MASPALITPTSTPKSLSSSRPKSPIIAAASSSSSTPPATTAAQPLRREFLSITSSIVSSLCLNPLLPALAASDEEYVKETEEVIDKVRTTITMDKNDPNVAEAVAQLRETSNSWVAKYRREKALLGRASFRDMYSALNAISGHYISFGPTAPIPAKRKARILEEIDTAQKSLQRGR
ncbi:photosystem II repair protein PSB27-H1, chloroplastic-like [Prosopis cineraria]|uniref:photosystem II repair protein PSB27-H1, chloroplastic-like n=1 Tax=Prosopis cineraria TaxID=364024 RepID=UPI00240FDB32|nr:photosystem II repair protein PSB27-H1, chloroplastic-like [Prosopis cineraria]XP_054794781.1 photosystem II repair protein PSB27-H1, chloroplastic-like [Prosopis cineraria]XP_054816665.1 photosystem II repair protein PSB27-H1, chloroplastic-like [Prosopis cineraria]